MEPTALESSRLLLRAPAAGDAQSIVDAIQDQQIPYWIEAIPWPYRISDARSFVDEIAIPGWRSGTSPVWLISDGVTGDVLGSIGLTRQAPEVYSVGFWLAPAARGRGFATEAVRLVCEFAFQQMSARRIEWQAIVGNLASRKVAHRTGFTFEGITRRRLSRHGAGQDAWLASLLPGDPTEPTVARLLPWSPVTLTRADLTLRAPRPTDAPWVLEAYEDDDIRQWNPGDVGDLKSAQTWVAERSDWSSDSHASWVFTEPETDQPWGAISLHKINAENLTASLGYWTHPGHRGRGRATQALELAADWAIQVAGLHRLEIIHAVHNPASCRVAKAAGFAWEGTTRDGERYDDGKWYDEHIHGRIDPAR